MNSDKHQFGGLWTVEKLTVLRKYLSFYTNALKNTAFRKLYIDAFAGAGQCVVNINGREQEIPGSATIALETMPPFDEYHFLEQNQGRVAQLEELKQRFPSRNIAIHKRDTNRFLPELLAGSWRDKRAVIFLDPYGLTIDWSTVEAISRTKAIDVLFLFSLSGVYRQAALSADALDEYKINALNRFLGTDEWRDVLYSEDRQKDLFNGTRESRHADWQAISEYIRKRLETDFGNGVIDPAILWPTESRNRSCRYADRRHSIPHAPVKAPSVRLFVAFTAIGSPGAPLLEEKLATCLVRLQPYPFYPFRSHGTRLLTGFTANDDPMHPG